MGTQGHAEVSFFDFPFRQFTFFQRVSNQRSFSVPLRGWSLLNVVLLVETMVIVTGKLHVCGEEKRNKVLRIITEPLLERRPNCVEDVYFPITT